MNILDTIRYRMESNGDLRIYRGGFYTARMEKIQQKLAVRSIPRSPKLNLLLMQSTLLLLLTTASLAAPGEWLPVIAKPWPETKKLSASRAEDFPKILDKISGSLIHRPYQNGPLGESSGEDPDPLYRLDVFDCTTYLETVMANAFRTESGTAKPECLKEKMLAIRYRGKQVGFAERNHIPESDWLPNNAKKGFIRDLRTSFYPDAKEWKHSPPVMERDAWLATKMKAPPAPEARKDPQQELNYLPVSFFFEPVPMEEKELAALKTALAATKKEIEERKKLAATDEEKAELDINSFHADLDFLRKTQRPLDDRLRAIPSGTVLNLVHAPLKDPAKNKLSPMITHQGLILQLADGAYLRHAAPNNTHVSSQKLDDYLRRYVRSANYRGISLFQILAPGK